jgi:hypothetical protein
LRACVHGARQPREEILLAGVLPLGEVRAMSKERAIIHYRAAMAVFARWLKEGIIDEDDLAAIEEQVAQKYGLSAGSIYR